MCFFPVQSVLTWHLFDSHNQTRLHPYSPLSQWQGKKIQQVLCKHPGNLVLNNLTMFKSPPQIDNKAGISSVSPLSQCSNNRIKALFYFPTDTVPPLLWKLGLSLKKQHLTGWGWNSVHIPRVNLFLITVGNKEEDNLSQNYAIFCKGSGSIQQECYFSGWVYGYTHTYFEQNVFFLFEGLCDIKTIPWKLAVYCAAVLRILAHGNNKVKAKIIEEGGVAPLLELCDPVELETNEITIGKG